MIGSSALAEAFWRDGRCDECPVYDMHGHMGVWHSIYFPRPDAPDMIRSMDSAGVKMLLFAHHGPLFLPDMDHQVAIEAVHQFPDRLRAYLCTNGVYPEQIERDLKLIDEHPDVFIGIKFLCDYHLVPMTDDRYKPAWELADARKLLVLAHTWSDSQYDGPKVVRRIAETYPNLSLLLGHSCHGDWDAAVQLARDFPNVYLELTAVLDNRGIIEKFVAEAGADRMLFGTDLPWFDPHHGIGALLWAHITDEDRHRILHRNAERLLEPLL
ncbi:MAG: amidohydrolase family protein [Phycisphaerae bacterium]|nr:amidohydrolase family protein [Phycisphaerae bacterium]